MGCILDGMVGVFIFFRGVIIMPYFYERLSLFLREHVELFRVADHNSLKSLSTDTISLYLIAH